MISIPTLNDFFCGAGGMGLGFKKAGYNILASYDFDKYAIQSYRENVHPLAIQQDISKLQAKEIPKSDVWTFGFPCQDLSIAGNKAGLFEGKRSGLFFEMMRLLDETPEECKPKIIMAENVKGLKPYLQTLKEEYAKVGYVMYVKLFNSKHWGVPQSRERYFVVGVRKDIDKGFYRFPKEQTDFIPKLSSILESNVPEKYYLSDEKSARIIEEARQRRELKNTHACLTPAREKRQNGPRAKEEEEDPMFTLTAQDLHGVIINNEVAATQELQSVFTDKDDCAYCCTARYFKGISPSSVGKARDTHIIEPSIDVMGRLEINGHDLIKRVYHPDGISPTVTAVKGGSQEVKIFDTSVFRVRKLTPREYARLQGFPDSFKFIVSDSQLYKQFGNAVTVNVAEAIAHSIKEHLS